MDMQNAPSTYATWVLIVLGVSLCFRWLMQTSKGDYFNQANEHYKQLRHLFDQPMQFQVEALKVVQLCQLAIGQRTYDGNAHVMLASAYFMLAMCFKYTQIYNYCIFRSVAVIKKWHSGNMYTKDSRNGQYIYQEIMEHVKIVRSLSPELAESIIKAAGELYNFAVNPTQFKELEDLTVSEALIETASELHKQGNMLHAITQYTQVLKQNPHNSRALYGRSLAFNDLNRYRFALEDIGPSYSARPKLSFYWW